MDQIGGEGQFLALKQPFIVGRHPDETSLNSWMRAQGWCPWQPPTDLALFQDLTWRRDDFLATDVRPENALVAEADGQIRAIDFIMGKVPTQ
jgi:hypothetical protein